MADTIDSPRPTGRPHVDVTLTGGVFPWDGMQPVLLSMPGSELYYLPVFSTEDKLRDLMATAGVPFVSIKRVDDGGQFLASVYENQGALETIRVILDPHYLPNGRCRFTQILLPDTN